MKNKMKLAGALLAIMMSATSVINAQTDWSLTGNAGTTSGTNFIGTTDAKALIFKTNGTATTNERMRITSTGNVGIGQTGPTSKLAVHNSGTSYNLDDLSDISTLFILGSSQSENMSFDKNDIQARNNGAAAKIQLNYFGGSLHFGKDVTAASATTPIMFLNSSNGRVGIGTSSPAYRLHVFDTADTRAAFINNDYSGASNKFGVYSNVTSSGTGSKYGMYSLAENATDNASAYGIYAKANADVFGGSNYGVRGVATGNGIDVTNYGVYGSASGTGTSAVNYGVYGTASGDDNWAGYFTNRSYASSLAVADDLFPSAFGTGGTGTLSAKLAVHGDAWIQDKLVLGSVDPAIGYKLSVDGKIICEELKVQTATLWPDYVFADNYKLATLEEVEQHIKDKKHLPGIPSACEVEENGIMIGEMQNKLMEKVEELTLYMIELKKENKLLKEEMNLLKSSK